MSNDLDPRPGDDIAYLLDRTAIVNEDDLNQSGDDELVRMALEWLQGYDARFFFTVARNYQPVDSSDRNTFDSHDDSVLLQNKAALMDALPRLAAATGGALWVIVAAEDVEATVRSAITFKAN